jgi:hypothetical protein
MGTTTIAKGQLSFPINVGEPNLDPGPTLHRAKPPAAVQDWEEVSMFDPDNYADMAIILHH